MRTYQAWTIDEEKRLHQRQAVLKAEGDHSIIKTLSKEFKRTESSIKQKLFQLGLTSSKPNHMSRIALTYRHHREWLCPHCGINVMVQGDSGWEHGMCLRCWREALAFAHRQDERDTTARREYGQARTEKSRKKGKSFKQI